jgi:hypothetical protein
MAGQKNQGRQKDHAAVAVAAGKPVILRRSKTFRATQIGSKTPLITSTQTTLQAKALSKGTAVNLLHRSARFPMPRKNIPVSGTQTISQTVSKACKQLATALAALKTPTIVTGTTGHIMQPLILAPIIAACWWRFRRHQGGSGLLMLIQRLSGWAKGWGQAAG